MNGNDIQTGMNQIDIGRSIFSAYCGVPATRLGLYLDGAKEWTGADLGACGKSLRELLDLAKSIEPIPVDWRKVGLVKSALQARAMQKTWVVNSSSGIFCGLDQAYRPAFDQTGVALTGEAAHKTCEELRKLNFQNVRAVERQLLAGETSRDFFAAWKPR